MSDMPGDPDLIDCRWCEQRHTDFWLCEPAREVLNKLWEKTKAAAEIYDMPTVEFTNAQDDNIEGVLVKAFMVRALHTEVLGVYRPGLAIDAIAIDDTKLRPLILIDDDDHIRRAGRLFEEQALIAIRRARRARDEAFKNRSV